MGRKHSDVAGIDDAETVAFGVGQHHEVGIGGVVPGHSSCTKTDEPVDLGRLLGGAVDHEIEMNPRLLLDWTHRSIYSDSCSDAVGGNQDREAVIRTREPDDFVAERFSPKGHSTIDIVGTQDDCPEAKHDESLARRENADSRRAGTREWCGT